MKSLFIASSFFLSCSLFAQEVPPVDWDELRKTKPWETSEHYKEIPIVTPGADHSASSDATVLFDGKNLNAWQKNKYEISVSMKKIVPIVSSMESSYTTEAAPWNVEKDEMIVAPGTGAIATKKAFGDVQLHLEWNAPVAEGKVGHLYSNSCVFFMGMY